MTRYTALAWDVRARRIMGDDRWEIKMKTHTYKWIPIESPYDFHTNQMYEIRCNGEVIVPDIMLRKEIMNRIGIWTCPHDTGECHPLGVYQKETDRSWADNIATEQMLDVLVHRLDNGACHYIVSCPVHGVRDKISEIPKDRGHTCDKCGRELAFGKVYEKVLLWEIADGEEKD